VLAAFFAALAGYAGHLEALNARGEAAIANKAAGQANERAAEANERAALANKAAAEASLALEKIKAQVADRDIPPEQQKKISAELSQFQDQPAKIVVFPFTFENDAIAKQIYSVLHDAKWNVNLPEHLAVAPKNLTMQGNNLLVEGVFIDHSSDESSRQAADALRSELNSTSAQTLTGSELPNASGAIENPDKPLVWILVGDKPAPLGSSVTK
jgi:hypothetical protein